MSMTSFAFLAVEHDTRLSIYVGSALLGLGIGFSFAAMANLIVEAVDQRQTGVATGMNTIMRTIGGSLGGQVAASIVAGHVIASTGLPSESGFITAFTMSAIALAVAFAVTLTIPGRRAGESADAAAASVGRVPATPERA
jgi:MFS family permease